MRILVTYAVQGEFTELKFPGLIGGRGADRLSPYRCGKGEIGFYLSEAISHAQPDLVVNVGTAGTIRHQVGDIFVCRHFVDRDMQKLVELGMEYEINSMDLLSQKDIVYTGRQAVYAIRGYFDRTRMCPVMLWIWKPMPRLWYAVPRMFLSFR